MNLLVPPRVKLPIHILDTEDEDVGPDKKVCISSSVLTSYSYILNLMRTEL